MANEAPWFKSGYEVVKEEAARSGFGDEFRMDDGDTVKCRFLAESPISFRQHNPNIDGKWPKYTCRQGMEGGCPLCKVGHKARFVGAFPVFDYRDNKVKVYVQGIRVLKVLDRLHAREGGLMGQDFEITRTGTGTDTTYNFIPLAPTEAPAEAKNPDGTLKSADLGVKYAPRPVEELTGVATRLGGAATPPVDEKGFSTGKPTF